MIPRKLLLVVLSVFVLIAMTFTMVTPLAAFAQEQEGPAVTAEGPAADAVGEPDVAETPDVVEAPDAVVTPEAADPADTAETPAAMEAPSDDATAVPATSEKAAAPKSKKGEKAASAKEGDVAMTGGEYYPTLQAAIDAALPGQIVILLADVTEEIAFKSTTSRNIKLDLNSHTLTSNGTTVTVNMSDPNYYAFILDGTVTSTGTGEDDHAIYVINGITSTSYVTYRSAGTVARIIGDGVFATGDDTVVEATGNRPAIVAEGNSYINAGDTTIIRNVKSDGTTLGAVRLSGTGESVIGGTVTTAGGTGPAVIVSNGSLTVDGAVITAGGTGPALKAGGINDGKGVITVYHGEIKSVSGPSVALGTSDSTFTIDGGKYSDDVGNGAGFTRKEDLLLEDKDGDGWYTFPAGTAQNANTGIVYPHLADAVAAASAGDTIKMIESDNIDSTITIDKTLTLDLNKKTIYSLVQTGLLITGSAGFTLKDSGGNYVGALYRGNLDAGNGDARWDGVLKIQSSGDVTLEGGTIYVLTGFAVTKAGSGKLTLGGAVIDNPGYGGIHVSEGSFDLLSGQVDTYQEAVEAAPRQGKTVEINIKGGTVRSINSAIEASGSFEESSIKVNITGGSVCVDPNDRLTENVCPAVVGTGMSQVEVTVSGDAVIKQMVEDKETICNEKGPVTIKGGTVIYQQESITEGITASDGVAISGGWFSTKVAENYLASEDLCPTDAMSDAPDPAAKYTVGEHDWDTEAVEIEWNEDNTECTATAYCKNDPSHELTETVTPVPAVSKKPTATEWGWTTYTANFTNEVLRDAVGEDNTFSQEDIEPLGVYEVTEGGDQTWTKGSGVSLDFHVEKTYHDDTTFDSFTSIQVDGKTVPATEYKTEKGSVIIKIQPAYLETLSAGKHTLTAQFKDGGADATFTIKEGGAKTGDDTNIALWSLIMAGSLLVMTGAAAASRRKEADR